MSRSLGARICICFLWPTRRTVVRRDRLPMTAPRCHPAGCRHPARRRPMACTPTSPCALPLQDSAAGCASAVGEPSVQGPPHTRSWPERCGRAPPPSRPRPGFASAPRSGPAAARRPVAAAVDLQPGTDSASRRVPRCRN
jgi:hypothetical protein